VPGFRFISLGASCCGERQRTQGTKHKQLVTGLRKTRAWLNLESTISNPNMNWLIRSLLVIVVVLFPLGWHSVAGEPPKARDLSLYDLAGPYSLDCSARHAEDQPILEAAIREFLWSRWQQRRLAHVAVVQYSLEGLPTRAWYFIEPDKHGVWHVVVEQDSTIPAFKPNSNEHQREAHRYEVYSLDRIGLYASEDAASIPDKDQRPSDKYKLRLKNKSGELIWVL
jgi:hypothetical protein